MVQAVYENYKNNPSKFVHVNSMDSKEVEYGF
jgi:hypothetical protein